MLLPYLDSSRRSEPYCSINSGGLISLTSLKGAKYFQLRPEGLSGGQ